jgi:hypothetical protein
MSITRLFILVALLGLLPMGIANGWWGGFYPGLNEFGQGPMMTPADRRHSPGSIRRRRNKGAAKRNVQAFPRKSESRAVTAEKRC